MEAYRKERIENAIAYFASEYKKRTKKNIPQTALYKALAFVEFALVEETGRTFLRLSFKAMKNGHVPKEIYTDKKYRESELYSFKELEKSTVIVPKKEYDLDYFSPHEIEEMKRVAEIYFSKEYGVDLLSEASHQEIKAWEKAFNDKENRLIKYTTDVFENIRNKSDEELTIQEERILTEEAFLELCK